MNKIFVMASILLLAACDTEAPKCNANKEGLISNLNEWMQEAVTDNFPLKVTSVENFYEIKSSPSVLGTTVYDDYKGARLCSVTANVEISDKKGNKFNDSIDVRYQLTVTLPEEDGRVFSGIRMSGYDVKEMTEGLQAKIIKNLSK